MASPLNTPTDFWKRVELVDNCWVWTGAKFDKGYGAFKFQGKQWRTHRLAWTLMHGAIPAGLQVNHHCDNPACVNTAHLYLGDQKQNRQDAVRRGRTATGERHGMHTRPESRRTGERNGNSKLTDGQRAEVRQRHAQGDITYAQLACEYGLSLPGIQYAVNGRAGV